MQKILTDLFDYQRFERNGRLSEIIGVAEEEASAGLTDAELMRVNAAGEPDIASDRIKTEPRNRQ